MGSSMSVEAGDPPARLHYQVAVSNHMFNDEVGIDDLACMNCLRVEMGERACYTGVCDMCGETPPSLQWMYPQSESSGAGRRGGRGGRASAARRRLRHAETRSASSDRPQAAPAGPRRRMSAESAVAGGLSPARLDLYSFTHNYSRVVGVDSRGEDKDSTNCVICLTDFQLGDRVRRLACIHLFHVSCVDNWLRENRCCPVCRVDVEAAAAQFR